jgi:hypothetical protein
MEDVLEKNAAVVVVDLDEDVDADVGVAPPGELAKLDRNKDALSPDDDLLEVMITAGVVMTLRGVAVVPDLFFWSAIFGGLGKICLGIILRTP